MESLLKCNQIRMWISVCMNLLKYRQKIRLRLVYRDLMRLRCSTPRKSRQRNSSSVILLWSIQSWERKTRVAPQNQLILLSLWREIMAHMKQWNWPVYLLSTRLAIAGPCAIWSLINRQTLMIQLQIFQRTQLRVLFEIKGLCGVAWLGFLEMGYSRLLLIIRN